MDLKELRKARMARLAKKAESQTNMYNPHVQKPSHLEPVGPRGGYHYYGPMPDLGTSYGLYEDEKGEKAVCMAGERVYSPFSGTEMKFIEEFPAEQVKEMVPTEAAGEHSCTSCRTPLILSDKKAASAQEKLFCTQCGSEMADVLAKIKTEVESQFDPEAPKPSHEPEEEVLVPVEPLPDSSEEEPAEEAPEEPAPEEEPEEPAAEEPAEEPAPEEEEPSPEASTEAETEESTTEEEPEEAEAGKPWEEKGRDW